MKNKVTELKTTLIAILGDGVVGAAEHCTTGAIGDLVVGVDGAKVGTNALHSQTPIRGGMEGQKASRICPV